MLLFCLLKDEKDDVRAGIGPGAGNIHQVLALTNDVILGVQHNITTYVVRYSELRQYLISIAHTVLWH
jgi:hypothetical protein